MIRGIRCRIYPSEEQKELFERTFGCVRFVYNKLLERQIINYEQGGKFVNRFGMNAWLTQLKNENEWLKEVDSRALKEAMFALEYSYQNFFRVNKGFPRFKSKKGKAVYTTNANLGVGKGFIKIPKAKMVKASRNLGVITPKKITVFRSADRYYASVLYDDGQFVPEAIAPKTFVGIDLGIKDYAILSNGVKFPNPKYLRKSEKHLKFLQRQLSKKQKGSNRRSKARLKLARQHEKIKGSSKKSPDFR